MINKKFLLRSFIVSMVPIPFISAACSGRSYITDFDIENESTEIQAKNQEIQNILLSIEDEAIKNNQNLSGLIKKARVRIRVKLSQGFIVKILNEHENNVDFWFPNNDADSFLKIFNDSDWGGEYRLKIRDLDSKDFIFSPMPNNKYSYTFSAFQFGRLIVSRNSPEELLSLPLVNSLPDSDYIDTVGIDYNNLYTYLNSIKI